MMRHPERKSPSPRYSVIFRGRTASGSCPPPARLGCGDQSRRALLARLATIVRNQCAFGADERTRVAIRRETPPDPWQRRAFQLLANHPWPVLERTQ